MKLAIALALILQIDSSPCSISSLCSKRIYAGRSRNCKVWKPTANLNNWGSNWREHNSPNEPIWNPKMMKTLQERVKLQIQRNQEPIIVNWDQQLYEKLQMCIDYFKTEFVYDTVVDDPDIDNLVGSFIGSDDHGVSLSYLMRLMRIYLSAQSETTVSSQLRYFQENSKYGTINRVDFLKLLLSLNSKPSEVPSTPTLATLLEYGRFLIATQKGTSYTRNSETLDLVGSLLSDEHIQIPILFVNSKVNALNRFFSLHPDSLEKELWTQYWISLIFISVYNSGKFSYIGMFIREMINMDSSTILPLSRLLNSLFFNNNITYSEVASIKIISELNQVGVYLIQQRGEFFWRFETSSGIQKLVRLNEWEIDNIPLWIHEFVIPMEL